jgi:hypothetical protein
MAVTKTSMVEPYSIRVPGESNSSWAMSEISKSLIAYSESGISISSTLISRDPYLFGFIVICPSLCCISAKLVSFKLTEK